MPFYKVPNQLVKNTMDLMYITAQRPEHVFNIKLTDIPTIKGPDEAKEKYLFVQQSKTRMKLRITLSERLEEVIGRIKRSRKNNSALNRYLLTNEKDVKATEEMIRFRFEKARELAGVNFQLTDLRAKGGATQIKDVSDASKLLGHTSEQMTKNYRSCLIGEKVNTNLQLF